MVFWCVIPKIPMILQLTITHASWNAPSTFFVGALGVAIAFISSWRRSLGTIGTPSLIVSSAILIILWPDCIWFWSNVSYAGYIWIWILGCRVLRHNQIFRTKIDENLALSMIKYIQICYMHMGGANNIGTMYNIWVNYNISLTWIKATDLPFGLFPHLNCWAFGDDFP